MHTQSAVTTPNEQYIITQSHFYAIRNALRHDEDTFPIPVARLAEN